MSNEVTAAIEFACTTAAQPMIRTCRKLAVGHSLTPDDVDDLREGANWMEGASLFMAQREGPVKSSTSKVVVEQDGNVISFVLDPNGVFARAEFPHPMVIVYRDAAGNVIGVNAVGRFTQPALQIYTEWRKTITSTEALVVKLANIESTIQPAPADGGQLSIGNGYMDVLVSPDDLVAQLSVEDRRSLVKSLYRVM